jgi:hypothetical protein
LITDKFVHIVTGHDPNLYVPFFKSQVVAASIDGTIYVAKDSEGEWIAVSVWFGPGKEMHEGRVILTAWMMTDA